MTKQKCRQGVMMTKKRDYEQKLIGGVKKRVVVDIKEKRW
jgi:hypothetical protein